MKHRKISTTISAGCLLTLSLFTQGVLANFEVSEEGDYPTYGRARNKVFEQTVDGTNEITEDDKAFLRTVDKRRPKREGYYLKGGFGSASTAVSGIENTSVPVVLPGGQVNTFINNTPSRFEDDLKNLLFGFGYKSTSWGAEFELAFSKILFFGYDPLLTADPVFTPVTGGACVTPSPIPATDLRASFNIKEITGMFNFMYFLPHLSFQPEGLDFYALLGLGFAFLSDETRTTSKVGDWGDANAPFPDSLSSPANQPLYRGQTREIVTGSTTNLAGHIGAGVRYALISRLFVDLSMRYAHHGAVIFGPVEGKTDTTVFNPEAVGPACTETIPPFNGIKFRARKVANTSVLFSAGVPLG